MIVYGLNPVIEALRAGRVRKLRVGPRADRRIEEAVDSYCRSQSAQADSPAGGRLRALNRSCGMG